MPRLLSILCATFAAITLHGSARAATGVPMAKQRMLSHPKRAVLDLHAKCAVLFENERRQDRCNNTSTSPATALPKPPLPPMRKPAQMQAAQLSLRQVFDALITTNANGFFYISYP
ncbi:hypothetical protein GQ54DRAFT_35303 [Martensiomyces pterosporus]|nr:hypothetical protein GQ54DRAFT_35303 [Martensiomyces pterosporus]